MNHIYTQQNLDNEQLKVIHYLKRISEYRNYPQSYVTQMYEQINKVYSLFSIEPNFELLNDKEVIAAFEFANYHHNGIFRNYSKDPYIVHPMEMASRLSSIKGISKEEIIAAILHDVVEDCSISLQDIENKFGKDVAIYVKGLTDIAKPEDGNAQQRFQINLIHFIESHEKVKNIKLVDSSSNLRTIIICDAKFSDAFFPNSKQIVSHLNDSRIHVDENLLISFNKQIAISNDIFNLQSEFNILKIEKKLKNKNAKIKNRQTIQL